MAVIREIPMALRALGTDITDTDNDCSFIHE
jgi:hypothetical protein